MGHELDEETEHVVDASLPYVCRMPDTGQCRYETDFFFFWSLSNSNSKIINVIIIIVS